MAEGDYQLVFAGKYMHALIWAGKSPSGLKAMFVGILQS